MKCIVPLETPCIVIVINSVINSESGLTCCNTIKHQCVFPLGWGMQVFVSKSQWLSTQIMNGSK